MTNRQAPKDAGFFFCSIHYVELLCVDLPLTGKQLTVVCV